MCPCCFFLVIFLKVGCERLTDAERFDIFTYKYAAKKPPEHPMLRQSPLLRLNRHNSGGLLKQKWIKPALTDDTCYPVTRLLLLYCTYRTRRTRGACIALKTQWKQNINHCAHVATNKNDMKATGTGTGGSTALNFTRETTSESKLPQMTSSNSSSWSNNEGGKWYKKEKQRIK